MNNQEKGKEPINETEKVKILLAQLKIANDKWLYFENQRLHTLEIFLSFSGISTVLFYANVEKLRNIFVDNNVHYIIPFLFLFIGLTFSALFWYREYYYQLMKSWCKRIEQELQLLYKNEQYRSEEDYDGAYRLYYFATNFDCKGGMLKDLSSLLHGLSICIITTLITYLTFKLLFKEISPCATITILIVCVFLFYLTCTQILRFLKKKYRRNQHKSPPIVREK